jgi:hypothetical protein
MKVIFRRYQDVLEIVNNGVQDLGAAATETQRTMHREERKKDGKVLFIIHQRVDHNIFEKILDQETAKEAWDNLKKAYGGDDILKKVKLQALMRQY